MNTERNILDLIKLVEESDFRTNEDTGANHNALCVWNRVRQWAGLPRITLDDLPAFCTTHQTYHHIREDYGCQRKQKNNQPD